MAIISRPVKYVSNNKYSLALSLYSFTFLSLTTLEQDISTTLTNPNNRNAPHKSHHASPHLHSLHSTSHATLTTITTTAASRSAPCNAVWSCLTVPCSAVPCRRVPERNLMTRANRFRSPAGMALWNGHEAL
ncbi:hypothetical protein E2C01_089194 [Portunus trituberculatus]|uniref:Uncharacterized protein n=1 Tax=Portunus trituberculatus TaxID=210409 RepID=A0A5B7JCV3_PORTR|nr:hypothetical protein [Portunus trituberculatus]